MLQDLVRSDVVHPGSSFWGLAFEGVLLELLDAHSSVRGAAGGACFATNGVQHACVQILAVSTSKRP